MCGSKLWKKSISFVATLFLGILANSLFLQDNFADKKLQTVKSPGKVSPSNNFIGAGVSSCNFNGAVPSVRDCFACNDGKEVIQPVKEIIQPIKGKSAQNFRSETKSLQVISKPKPNYTDTARQNQVSGIVRLRVQFLASGQIGSVSSITGLPDGLTEQAIKAAKQIKFTPVVRDGKSRSTIRIVEYNFTIY